MESKITEELLRKASLTVAMMSADAVEKANSGHPGMPMGASDHAALLWLKYLSVNPRQPKWINRDRFVLSNGHGSMLLYSLLHLLGYDLSLEEIKQFRQWGSRTPGHPESHLTPGVECTTGPLGQGIANAVGMAIGEKIMASRYNTNEHKIFDHRVFCFVGDGCLMEGISSEASSLAGHLGLNNLIVFYDDNKISIAGSTDLTFSEDVLERYRAYNWNTYEVDGHDFQAIDKIISKVLKQSDTATQESASPTLIAVRTIIGRGSPHKADTAEAHGAPLGKEELQKTKESLGWPLEPSFFVPDDVTHVFKERQSALEKEYARWIEIFNAWQKKNPELASNLDRQLKLHAPSDFESKLLASVSGTSKPTPTRKLSSQVLQVASREMNSLLGGSADLEPSTLTVINDSTSISEGDFSGLNLHFGVREHAMGAVMNGLAYYGGFIPYGSTFLTFSDYMRPAIRIAALAKLPGLFIFTHDSVFLGEDGPTHQAVEHIAALRLIPNLYVMRPCDGVETAVCYALALARHDGPTAICLSRQNLTPPKRTSDFDLSLVRRGGYILYEAGSKPEIVIIATGSEVSLALEVASELERDIALRVVSIPCLELFSEQSADYREDVIPIDAKKVIIEAGITGIWNGLLPVSDPNTLCIGVDDFGASAPAGVLAEKLGLTKDAVIRRVKGELLKK